jgi:hypothetical protein
MQNLLFAARPLANDFLSTIAFALLVALKVDVRIAIAASMVIGQIALQLRRSRPVAAAGSMR